MNREFDEDYYVYRKSGPTAIHFAKVFTVQAGSFEEAGEAAGKRFAGYGRDLNDGEMIIIQAAWGEGNLLLMRVTVPQTVLERV
jgi:hypothetical protein